MDMNTRNNKLSLDTELVYIGGIGFMFEVNQSFKHNLISPDVLTFFDGVPENGEVSKNCAFPFAKPYTNLRQSIFQHIGFDWVVCSDGIFRKCTTVKCIVEYRRIFDTVMFHVDSTICDENIAGIISLKK